ncbi:MAG TPA: T9SS type A sorting domain-containing protein [Ignavibacteria bacterium]|nr:T9SS type A sorting domain-containing protein [Ignavibacteria bacterium]HRJ98353.1 T9SS type A sorting domain-containing protein [Ignavibacteria bacterium]
MKPSVLFLIAYLFITSNLNAQQITWARTYGDTGTVSEQGVDILQTFDGNYVVLATRSYDGNNQKILLLKLDIYGNIMWEKMVADSIISHNPYRFQQTHDSGFIITGVSGSAFLIKTDKDGNLKWRKIYTQTYPQTYSSSVITTMDNGYIFCGRVPFFNPPSDRGYIVKTDPSGNVQWERVYEDSLFTTYNEIIQTKKYDGYYLVGRTYNITQPVTFYTVCKKMNLTGEIKWSNTFGKNSTGLNVMILDDTSLIINSSKQSPFSPRLFRIDTSGIVIWDSIYQSPSFSGGIPFICKDSQNNIQKVGGVNGNVTYTEISPLGGQHVLRPFQTSGFLSTYSNIIKNTIDGGFMIVGTVFTGNQFSQKVDIMVLKTDSLVHGPVLVSIPYSQISSIATEFELLQNYPNPFNSETMIEFILPQKKYVEIHVYDIRGKIVKYLKNEYMNEGNYKVKFNGNDLSSGIYFYSMKINGNFIVTKVMLLIK